MPRQDFFLQAALHLHLPCVVALTVAGLPLGQNPVGLNWEGKWTIRVAPKLENLT